MTVINLDNVIVPIDKILDKKISETTFLEIASIFFHIETYALCNNHLYDIYREFNEDQNLQNSIGWPEMEIRENKFHNRLEVTHTKGDYIITNNVFSLLFRLLYIEKCKIPYGKMNILDHTISKVDDKQIKDLFLIDIMDILQEHLIYYTVIHHNQKHFEYQLAKTILELIE